MKKTILLGMQFLFLNKTTQGNVDRDCQMGELFHSFAWYVLSFILKQTVLAILVGNGLI